MFAHVTLVHGTLLHGALVHGTLANVGGSQGAKPPGLDAAGRRPAAASIYICTTFQRCTPRKTAAVFPATAQWGKTSCYCFVYMKYDIHNPRNFFVAPYRRILELGYSAKKRQTIFFQTSKFRLSNNYFKTSQATIYIIAYVVFDLSLNKQLSKS